MATLTMKRGNTKRFTATVTQSGVAYDLDNAAGLWFTARRDPESPVLFAKSLGDGITITNAAAGTALITLAAADTEDLPSVAIQLEVDLEMETDTGEIHTVFPPEGERGILVVEPDITVR